MGAGMTGIPGPKGIWGARGRGLMGPTVAVCADMRAWTCSAVNVAAGVIVGRVALVRVRRRLDTAGTPGPGKLLTVTGQVKDRSGTGGVERCVHRAGRVPDRRHGG